MFGGLNFVAVRYSNDGLAPLWGAGLRTLAAAVVLLALAFALRVPLPRGAALTTAVVYGLLAFGLATALGYLGLKDAPAGLGSVLTSLAPLLTIGLATAHGLERVERQRVLGAILAAGGVTVVFADQLGEAVPLLAQLAVLGSVLSLCEGTVLLKMLPRAHPLATNAVGMSVGAVFLVILTVVTGEPIALPAASQTWIAVGYLVIGNTALFSLYLYLLGRWPASAVSFVFVLFPIVTISVGALLRGERVGLSFLAGAALIVAGVYVGAIARRPAVATVG